MLKVPMLVTYCGVPMRAAAATSSFMLGVTAASSVVIYYAHGDVVPALAAAAVLGAQVGTRAGLFVGARADVKMVAAHHDCDALHPGRLMLVSAR